MLYILHKDGVSRQHISAIMKDLKTSGIFDEPEDLEGVAEEDWELIEEQAFWVFESDVSNKEKINALRTIKQKQEEIEQTRMSQYFMEQERRVLAKRQELIAAGLIKPEPVTYSPHMHMRSTTRYGRTPLHEAVAMRDLRLVRKHLQSGKYLDKVDNNGHTAMEMAYYEGYTEALSLFKKYAKAQK